MPHTCSNFCRTMPATVTSMVALLTLLSSTKPSSISSTWSKSRQEDLSFETKRKDLLDNKSAKWSMRIAPHCLFFSPNWLIRSSGRVKWLMKNGFNVKYPIILDASHQFVKLFLEHTHVKHYHYEGVK